MLSSSCRHGIRSLVYLAGVEEGDGAYVSIRRISEDLDVSFHFLTKTLQELTRDKLVRSHRGCNGGVALARPPKDITVLEVVECLDGADFFSGCVLGLPACNSRSPCALHGRWTKERDRLHRMFGSTTLAQLARDERASG